VTTPPRPTDAQDPLRREIETDLDAALTAMSEAGVSSAWPEADARAVLTSIDEAYRRLYVRASERDRALAAFPSREAPAAHFGGVGRFLPGASREAPGDLAEIEGLARRLVTEALAICDARLQKGALESCPTWPALLAAVRALAERAEEAEERAESWKETATRERNRLITEANDERARAEAAEKERDRCREMFDVTRHRVCERMGLPPGTAWNNIESALSAARRAAIEEAANIAWSQGNRFTAERIRSLAASLRAEPGALAPWYEADGSVTMLPAPEVERRRKLAAKVIGAARKVASDHAFIAGQGAVTCRCGVCQGLRALDAASPPPPTPEAQPNAALNLAAGLNADGTAAPIPEAPAPGHPAAEEE
jgi:hypothetical protein